MYTGTYTTPPSTLSDPTTDYQEYQQYAEELNVSAPSDDTGNYDYEHDDDDSWLEQNNWN